MHRYNPVLIHVTENTRRRDNRSSFSSSNTISTVMQPLTNSGVTSHGLRNADCHRPISGSEHRTRLQVSLRRLGFSQDGGHVAFYTRSEHIYEEEPFPILRVNEGISSY